MNIITKSFYMAFEPLFGKFSGEGSRTANTPAISPIEALIRKMSGRRRANRAIRELSRLSNETLRDIGIERGNIPELVESMMNEQLGGEKTARHARQVEKHATGPATTIPVSGGSAVQTA